VFLKPFGCVLLTFGLPAMNEKIQHSTASLSFKIKPSVILGIYGK